MSIGYNGTNIDVLKYGATTVDKVIYNGTTVLEKLKEKGPITFYIMASGQQSGRYLDYVDSYNEKNYSSFYKALELNMSVYRSKDSSNSISSISLGGGYNTIASDCYTRGYCYFSGSGNFGFSRSPSPYTMSIPSCPFTMSLKVRISLESTEYSGGAYSDYTVTITSNGTNISVQGGGGFNSTLSPSGNIYGDEQNYEYKISGISVNSFSWN